MIGTKCEPSVQGIIMFSKAAFDSFPPSIGGFVYDGYLVPLIEVHINQFGFPVLVHINKIRNTGLAMVEISISLEGDGPTCSVEHQSDNVG